MMSMHRMTISLLATLLAVSTLSTSSVNATHEGCAYADSDNNNRVVSFRIDSDDGSLGVPIETSIGGIGLFGQGHFAIPRIAVTSPGTGRQCLFVANGHPDHNNISARRYILNDT